MKAHVAIQKATRGSETLCHYSYKMKGMVEPILKTSQPCYASLLFDARNAKKLQEVGLATTPANSRVERKDKKAYNKYVDFLLNRSVFRDAYKTKRVSAAARYGVAMSVEVCHSTLVGGCIALRQAWEDIHKVRTFDLLTNEGVDERVAYFIAQFVRDFSTTPPSGHSAVGMITVKEVKEVLEKGLYPSAVKDRASYKVFALTGKSTVYHDDGSGSLYKRLTDACDTKKPGLFGTTAGTFTKKRLIETAFTIQKEVLG